MTKKSQNFENLKNCPVCESKSIGLFKKGSFDYLNLSKENVKITDSDYGKIWDLNQCKQCSHFFANPSPRQNFIQSLYKEIEDPHYQDEALGREKNFNRILSVLNKIHPEKTALFDVGAATGILLNAAQKHGWKPEGIEPSVWSVKIAKEKYGIALQEGDFETGNIKHNYYDAVTMIDFLEHIPYPLPAMRKAHEILTPEGTLCVVTPDIKSLAARIMQQKW